MVVGGCKLATTSTLLGSVETRPKLRGPNNPLLYGRKSTLTTLPSDLHVATAAAQPPASEDVEQ